MPTSQLSLYFRHRPRTKPVISRTSLFVSPLTSLTLATGSGCLPGAHKRGSLRGILSRRSTRCVGITGQDCATMLCEVGDSIRELSCTSSVNCATFSPGGRPISAALNHQTACVCHYMTSEPACSPLRGHRGRLRPISYSPDRRRIVSGDWKGRTCV